MAVGLDLNLFVPPPAISAALELLEPPGVETEDRPIEVELQGKVRVRWGRNPVDLCFAGDALHEAMHRAAREVAFGDAQIRILAPEHLMVCNAVFDRRKGWLDIEQMLVGVHDLQPVEVFGWLEYIVGPDNQRLDRLQELWDRTRWLTVGFGVDDRS